jgi:hypothetical protein
MRVIHWIHRYTPHPRPFAKPPRPARFADRDIFALHIADLPNCGTACCQDQTHFPRGETQLRVFSFTGHELDGSPCTPCKLATLPRQKLYIVDRHPQRDILQSQGIPWPNLSLRSRRHRVTDP